MSSTRLRNSRKYERIEIKKKKQEEEEEMTTDDDREGNEKEDEGTGCIDMGK